MSLLIELWIGWTGFSGFFLIALLLLLSALIIQFMGETLNEDMIETDYLNVNLSEVGSVAGEHRKIMRPAYAVKRLDKEELELEYLNKVK